MYRNIIKLFLNLIFSGSRWNLLRRKYIDIHPIVQLKRMQIKDIKYFNTFSDYLTIYYKSSNKLFAQCIVQSCIHVWKILQEAFKSSNIKWNVLVD